jgi:hypothetical protein
MNSRHFAAAVGIFATACAMTACASTAGSGSPAASPSPAETATSAPPASSTGIGGRTMSAPHIACQKGTVEQTYDGSDNHPVELCVVTGAVAHITINPPSGAQWPLPSAGPTTIVQRIDSHRVGNALEITLATLAKGTAAITVGDVWELKIAVI